MLVAARGAMGVVAVNGFCLPVIRVAWALRATPSPPCGWLQQGRMLLTSRKLAVGPIAREAQEG